MLNISTGEVMCWLVELQWSWSPLELYNIDPYHDISDTAQPLTNTLLLFSSHQKDKTISLSPPYAPLTSMVSVRSIKLDIKQNYANKKNIKIFNFSPITCLVAGALLLYCVLSHNAMSGLVL